MILVVVVCALAAGVVVIAVLEHAYGPRCPVCGGSLRSDEIACRHCGHAPMIAREIGSERTPAQHDGGNETASAPRHVEADDIWSLSPASRRPRW